MTILLKEVGNLSDLLNNSYLSRSYLWDRPVSEITPIEIRLLVKQADLNGYDMRQEMNTALIEVRAAIAAGHLIGALIEQMSFSEQFGQSNVYSIAYRKDTILAKRLLSLYLSE